MVNDAKAEARKKWQAGHPQLPKADRYSLWGEYLTCGKDPAREEERREWIDKTHASRNESTDRRYRKYSLSVVNYNKLLLQQNGVCAICREPGRELCVDHDHRNGRVRSLLCGHCNSAIGFLRESPLLARAAATYLEQQLTKEFTGE